MGGRGASSPGRTSSGSGGGGSVASSSGQGGTGGGGAGAGSEASSARVVDIRPPKPNIMQSWEASLPPAQREALNAHRAEKELKRKIRNLEARQKRAAKKQGR